MFNRNGADDIGRIVAISSELFNTTFLLFIGNFNCVLVYNTYMQEFVCRTYFALFYLFSFFNSSSNSANQIFLIYILSILFYLAYRIYFDSSNILRNKKTQNILFYLLYRVENSKQKNFQQQFFYNSKKLVPYKFTAQINFFREFILYFQSLYHLY